MARLAGIAGLNPQPLLREATRPARSMKASSHPYYNCMTRPHLGLIGPRALFARGSTHIQPTFLPETGTNSGRALRIGAPFSSHHRQALAPSISGLAHPHCSSQLLSDRHPELRLSRPACASAVLDEAKTEHARHPQDGGLRAGVSRPIGSSATAWASGSAEPPGRSVAPFWRNPPWWACCSRPSCHRSRSRRGRAGR